VKFFAFCRTLSQCRCQILRVIFSLVRPVLLVLALTIGAFPELSTAQTLAVQVGPAGNATLTWNATATGPVSVQWSGNLSTWSVISAGNSNGTFTHATGNATRAFYRLVMSSFQMIFVQGGNVSATAHTPQRTVGNFSISKTEVTWSEWERVRNYAIANGYDLNGVGENRGSSHPVLGVNWYDVLKWCNAKSQMEGLSPAYSINGAIYKTGNSTIPAINPVANGYRMPTEAQWEWAARGGVLSNGYEFSGADIQQATDYVWYDGNSNGSLQAVGTKLPNELGIHDMSGNAFEWCWEIFDPVSGSRQIRGGSYLSILDFCAVDLPFGANPSSRNLPIGFRIVRN
jgi:sulfatase modifying factor 1